MPSSRISFLHGEFVPRCTHVIDKTFDDYCTLQLATEGRVSLAVGNARFDLAAPPQFVWSAYPGPRVRFHAARRADGTRGTWAHRFIAFRGAGVKRWMQQGLFPVPPQPAGAVVDLPARFDRLLALSRAGDPRSLLRGANLLEGMLLDIADSGTTAREHPLVAAARAQLEQVVARAETAPDYQSMAAGLGVSESTLRRRFAQTVGLGPHEYLLQARIAEARRLLGQTDLPIKAIAERLGYSDVYFFSRQFRQFTGVPPGMYRRSCQG